MSDLFRLYSLEEAALGRDGYPPEWHSIGGGLGLKHLVRARAGDRCLRCGHPYMTGMGEWSPCDEHCTHDGPLRFLRADGTLWLEMDEATAATLTTDIAHILREAQWRILTVHHLDEDKLNCRWWNLAALCQRDHLYIQRKVKMHRPWPWAHSGWFREYAAAHYAFKYLGENLSREEVQERMDDLLRLGAEGDAVERMPI